MDALFPNVATFFSRSFFLSCFFFFFIEAASHRSKLIWESSRQMQLVARVTHSIRSFNCSSSSNSNQTLSLRLIHLLYLCVFWSSVLSCCCCCCVCCRHQEQPSVFSSCLCLHKQFQVGVRTIRTLFFSHCDSFFFKKALKFRMQKREREKKLCQLKWSKTRALDSSLFHWLSSSISSIKSKQTK